MACSQLAAWESVHAKLPSQLRAGYTTKTEILISVLFEPNHLINDRVRRPTQFQNPLLVLNAERSSLSENIPEVFVFL